MRMTPIALALLLLGCPEVRSCPEDLVLAPDGSCRPLSDGGGDGGALDAGDAGGDPADGGACGRACAAPTPACDAARGECVECTDEDASACTGATPLCDAARGECVECTDEDASACAGATPLCDTARSACVECLGDADCTEPGAARCDAGVCAGCTASTQCVGVDGAEVCDADASSCVECTDEDASACGARPCTANHTCSAFDADREACQACDTDENCVEPGHFCVPTRYRDADRPGGYCLKTTTGGCEQPFSVRTPARPTLSGVAGMTFCGLNEALVTCEAVRALLDNQRCPGGTDAECPEGGLCRTVDVLANRCTYRCEFLTECLESPSPGSTCDQGSAPGGPRYCGG